LNSPNAIVNHHNGHGDRYSRLLSKRADSSDTDLSAGSYDRSSAMVGSRRGLSPMARTSLHELKAPRRAEKKIESISETEY